MTERILSVILCLSVLCSLCGCDAEDPGHDEPTSPTPSIVETESEQTEPEQIEQTDAEYIVHTDWMTFCFSKRDFGESDIADIVTEAESVMADVRNYLKVDYTLDEAKETVCCFDSTYRNDNGQNRSRCLWSERKMYCVSLDDFVHEYVHMISENNADLVYHPHKLISEGLAQYVSLHFYDGIASGAYVHFKAKSVSENGDASEHQLICDLFFKKRLPYTAENYNKAFVAILAKNYDVSRLDPNSDFYLYYIGHVFVDYCINQLGGLERFISVYCDSVTMVDVYGKTLDELVAEACAHNIALFYGK